MLQYRKATGPFRRETPEDLNARDRRIAWAWIAGALAAVILLAFVVDVSQGHPPTLMGPDMASNSPPMIHETVPNGPASRAYMPAPMNPANPPPLNPAHPQLQQ